MEVEHIFLFECEYDDRKFTSVRYECRTFTWKKERHRIFTWRWIRSVKGWITLYDVESTATLVMDIWRRITCLRNTSIARRIEERIGSKIRISKRRVSGVEVLADGIGRVCDMWSEGTSGVGVIIPSQTVVRGSCVIRKLTCNKDGVTYKESRNCRKLFLIMI